MDIYLASPRGFCAGVVLAIDLVEIALEKYGAPVYVKHQIVHNPVVVSEVESKGAITVEKVSEIPDNSVVVFSAHGSPPEDYKLAKEKNITVIDATCPLVTKVHNEAKKYSKEGKKIILVGHKGHQEVIGTSGQADMKIIDDREKFDLDKSKDEDVIVLSQTTLSVRDTQDTISKIKNVHPKAVVRNDICYATTNRQEVTVKLAKKVDLILVVGASNSSNCNRLKDVSIQSGTKAYLINSFDEIKDEWLKDVNKLGLTSGASTPDKLVFEIIKRLDPSNVFKFDDIEEDIKFEIPRKVKELLNE
ncbi:MAG: 4-hydroxy-3-methylbut-2-enyl diphosphate reductase [Chloroflexota bacterium]|jgi:4-hydroxy-3-methylbut-2-enyl diphosphate reductase|nr:4-hydroxy-3-methylbut-2-enyl diphosphate reductase [Chloroflexota bacterium]MQF83380.1 4-hydroxy-3-methylbut-2-enyl diphosphate reductase [SAR202 cluster bacterium]MEC9107657.1 4-hydroxy-3-methylbut-2-enyl diphosphate reductase [Chloroflexota bacterium]MED5237520.1 4-hydroxy-3-methylbut-2-enyl diphosphate reductase [Chloroflexota bacterium]MED5255536.1 4-hydroxy-3-methylbut-2-enyl diphosphate reductase [Chloroflexota bacterium]|tara:strand:+ start:557 stop:1468 length:912 start_codon:yes stop_codon:yes gene_type:complete